MAYDHLSRDEQIILGTAYLEGGVTNSRLQSMLELHSTEIGHILAGLVERKMLTANKKGRWTSYKLNENYEIQHEQVELADLTPKTIVFKNETDRIIYEYIQVNGFITTHQIVEITSLTTPQGALAALKRLRSADLVVKEQKGRQVIYKLKTQ
jgi:predicted HTH transcriptional regulator